MGKEGKARRDPLRASACCLTGGCCLEKTVVGGGGGVGEVAERLSADGGWPAVHAGGDQVKRRTSGSGLFRTVVAWDSQWSLEVRGGGDKGGEK